jgi:hypothetical protein
MITPDAPRKIVAKATERQLAVEKAAFFSGHGKWRSPVASSSIGSTYAVPQS